MGPRNGVPRGDIPEQVPMMDLHSCDVNNVFKALPVLSRYKRLTLELISLIF